MKKNLIVSIVVFFKDVDQAGFKIWTQERLEEGHLYKKWEFPGGKIEHLETPRDAAIREVDEEVGVDIKNSSLHQFKIQSYSYENRNICLYVFLSNFDQLPKEKGHWNEIKYTDKSTYLNGKIPPINHVIIDELAVYIEKQFHAGTWDLLWQT